MLAWVMRDHGVMAIPEADNVAHVEENHGCLGISLTDEDLLDIDAAFPPPVGKIPLAGW